MKTTCIIIIFILCCCLPLFSEETSPEPPGMEEPVVSSMDGFHVGMSAFDYFKVTAGVQFGEYSVVWHHFFASVYGISIEYQCWDTMTVRGFWRMYGGSGGMLIGLSVPVTTDFHTWTAGIAPEIGIGFGPMNIFYRYNFFLDGDFSNHEICVVIYFPI